MKSLTNSNIDDASTLKDLVSKYQSEIETHKNVISKQQIEINNQENQLQFAGLLKIGNQNLFKLFIQAYTYNNITLLNIFDEEVEFIFQDEQFTMNTADFLSGVFGPQQFNELSEIVKPIFISGLDSI